MPKLLIVILVLIAAVFAVGIGFGWRRNQTAYEKHQGGQKFGRDHSKGGVFALLSNAAGRVSASDIGAVPCLRENKFLINAGASCSSTIAPLGQRSIVIDVRKLTLNRTAGGSVKVTYDYDHRKDEEPPKLEQQYPHSETLPSQDTGDRIQMTVLRSGGALTLECQGAVSCVVEIQ